MTLKPVGVVRSPVKMRKAMPSAGVPARIEILPEYRPALLRIEKHSHIWVLVWLDRAERDVLQVTPKGVSDRGPSGLHGVFAVRAPVRPNPIGLTAARVAGIEGGAIAVDRLDFLDGTPVIDIKPYFASRDLIFSAVNLQIGRPADRLSLRESLVLQALNFHGELCPDLALTVRIVEHLRADVLGMADPGPISATAPVDRPCAADALMGMLRVTPGRRTLRFHGADAIQFDHAGARFSYSLVRPDQASAEGILASDDDALFRIATG